MPVQADGKAGRECILGIVADDLKHLFHLIPLPDGVGFQGHWMIGHWKKPCPMPHAPSRAVDSTP
ncbi:hypothetical protein [Nostoc sp.]|uniref:hypothetical protein n=1 Tax=Nostoc sp. TaxID=1180 RepID=UPI002FF8AFBD